MTRLAIALLTVLLFLPGLSPSPVVAQSIVIDLHAGWNNVIYKGETLPVERALASVAPATSAVWHWDASTDWWSNYFPAAPIIATLTALQPDHVYWLFATQAAIWEQPNAIQFTNGLANIVSGNGANHILRLELAETPEQRSRGLMYRPTLNPDTGMLFLFPASTETGFWMRDTLIPLSIAFLDENNQILDIRYMEPLSLTIQAPSSPYHAALEVNQGWFKANGIGVGDAIHLLGN